MEKNSRWPMIIAVVCFLISGFMFLLYLNHQDMIAFFLGGLVAVIGIRQMKIAFEQKSQAAEQEDNPE